jgi:hypothetical protein
MLINTPKMPTWQSKTGRQSTIDLTFINKMALNNAIIKNWQVNHGLSFTTDHFPITWDIDQGVQYTNEQPPTSRFNIKDTDPKKWAEAFNNAIEKCNNTFSHLTNTTPTQEIVKNAAITLQEALIEATQNTAKKTKPSEKAKPWWNTEIRLALKLAREWKLKLSKNY